MTLIKFKSVEKGSFGYISHKKKVQLIISAVSLLIVFMICITGILIYDTRKSIYAVLAALASLPAAKQLVGFLVLLPYKSVSSDFKEKLENAAGDMNYCIILYDVLLSSTEKALYAGTLHIKNGKIYGYANPEYNKNKASAPLSAVEKHIKFIIDACCNYSVIKLFDNEEKFLDAVAKERDAHLILSEDGLEKMKNMDERIRKQLNIYMF